MTVTFTPISQYEVLKWDVCANSHYSYVGCNTYACNFFICFGKQLSLSFEYVYNSVLWLYCGFLVARNTLLLAAAKLSYTHCTLSAFYNCQES